MRSVLYLALFAAGLAAQEPKKAELTPLIQDLRRAIEADSLVSAADLAGKLDGAIQERYSAWLIRDARERVAEVLAWLPDDIESFWVNQKPFTIKPDESIQTLHARPIQAYSLDRLMALNGGRMYGALGSRTVRLVLAAARNIREGQSGIPGPISAQDVVYFYFFTDPVELPAPDESIQGHPAWRATARVDAGGPFQPGVKRAEREDQNWMVLARADLLVLANRPELLDKVLERMSDGSQPQALPHELPEWSHVNQSASFWGLRHYSAQSKPKRTERGFDAADLPRPDGRAQGVVVQFDPVERRLEIEYLSPGSLLRRPGINLVDQLFQVDPASAGVWRLVSDIAAKGPLPVHFAMTMLGFGVYR